MQISYKLPLGKGFKIQASNISIHPFRAEKDGVKIEKKNNKKLMYIFSSTAASQSV